MSKGVENFFGDTITEIFVVGVCTHVDKWKYRNTFCITGFYTNLFDTWNNQALIGYSIHFHLPFYIFQVELPEQTCLYFNLIFYFIKYFVRNKYCARNG